MPKLWPSGLAEQRTEHLKASCSTEDHAVHPVDGYKQANKKIVMLHMCRDTNIEKYSGNCKLKVEIQEAHARNKDTDKDLAKTRNL